MALDGMTQMLVAALIKMGLDPNELMGMANNVKRIAEESGAALQSIKMQQSSDTELLLRIDTKLDRIEIMCDRIIGEIAPTPGGWVLGDGSPRDLEFNSEYQDAIRTLPDPPSVEPSETLLRESVEGLRDDLTDTESVSERDAAILALNDPRNTMFGSVLLSDGEVISKLED
jgi:hypothetical protein